MSATGALTQTVYRYQKTGDTVYYAIGSTENVWVNDGTGTANIKTAVTFAGASVLTAAAAAIASTLLF
jgi:D-tyrosyl-tRNA(Tyr) deacylase